MIPNVIYSILLIYHLAGFVFGTSSCVLLIWLILTNTSTIIKQYSRILLQTCIIDLILTILATITDALMVVENGQAYAFTIGLLKFIDFRWRYIILHVWSFIFIFNINATPIQHIYRYMVLCR